MSTTKWMALSLALAGLLVAGLAWQKHTSNHDAETSRAAGQHGLITAQVPGAPGDTGSNGTGLGPGSPRTAPQTGSPLDAVALPEFRVDSKGALVVDSNTRDGIELVAALYERDQALVKLAEATKDLPASAQRDVKDLYQRYVQYAQAVKQAFPAEQQEALTLAQAEAQFDKLQTIRETYLGDKAHALWARDDAITRKLFAYSADYLKQHPNATLIEASTVAQDRYAKEAGAMQGQAAEQP